ncbi:histidine phosphatase family protein [Fulvivirga sp. RKSG066]|uniref:histidine phosphatase family protein n=1 Tax=Fulvivirga aurantia TaxID=2529383 RepID=UPI0012BB649D|nr:histidine phosphatase family protein [Fulvivirga aurantia]MTI22793.1 histidine phosphatase family protein [Fulvivirga aurantia]
MKTKKIYLVRHGQTDYNRKKIVQGSGIDASLNDFGVKQAQSFYAHYKDVPFDKVYTSALKRSIQSMQQFIDKGVPHQVVPELNEINWGTREGMAITPEEDAYYHDVIKQWQEGNTTLKIEGGESPQDVFERQTKAIEIILANNTEETVLVCMHGRAMRVLLCQLLNYPLKCMDMFEHSNLCLYKLNYTGSMFNVELFNHTAHLNGQV